MPLAADTFEQVRRFLRLEASIVLDADKGYLVEARLSPVARRAGMADIEELVAAAVNGNDAGARRKVLEAMTTNETSFYRDVAPFEVLKTVVLPEVIARRAATKTLNIWCGAASSGQEPYSIAMLLADHFPELASWTVRIYATDLSEEMLTRCRAATYSQFEVNRGLPAPSLVRHFDRRGLNWIAKDELKGRVEFASTNLAKDWGAMPVWDVVFLRNVLIYIDADMKRQIMKRLRQVIDPYGWLFFGAAEAATGCDEGWERVPIDRASCFRPKP